MIQRLRTDNLIRQVNRKGMEKEAWIWVWPALKGLGTAAAMTGVWVAGEAAYDHFSGKNARDQDTLTALQQNNQLREAELQLKVQEMEQQRNNNASGAQTGSLTPYAIGAAGLGAAGLGAWGLSKAFGKRPQPQIPRQYASEYSTAALESELARRKKKKKNNWFGTTSQEVNGGWTNGAYGG